MAEKLLSVIIPYYKETARELSLPLSGLAIQAGVDFGAIECILVCDGGSRKIPDDFLALYNPDILFKRIYLTENKGPGVARQAGIDHADGEYVMFCDADDSLENALALKSLTESVRQSHPDIIVSPVIREEYDKATDSLRYALREDMRQVLHGKVYRKAFLEFNNIRFHEKLRTCEDTYFNGLAFACTENIRKTSIPSYIKRYRPGSLTRADDPGFHMENMPEYIKSIGYLLEAAKVRRLINIENLAAQYIIYFFFFLHKKKWLPPGKNNLLKIAEREFSAMIKPYLCYLEQAPDGFAAGLYTQLRQQYFEGETETETLNEWLARLNNI